MKAEEFIRDHAKTCSNVLDVCDHGGRFLVYHEWLTPEQALRAVELAREEMIEKACSWLELHDSYSTPTNVLVENLRKSLKERIS